MACERDPAYDRCRLLQNEKEGAHVRSIVRSRWLLGLLLVLGSRRCGNESLDLIGRRDAEQAAGDIDRGDLDVGGRHVLLHDLLQDAHGQYLGLFQRQRLLVVHYHSSLSSSERVDSL